MIKEDRLLLNERFSKVFQLLEERGVVVKNDRNGKGMGDFAAKNPWQPQLWPHHPGLPQFDR